MGLAEAFGDDQDQGPAERLVLAVAEDGLRTAVPGDDRARLVGDDDGFRRRLGDRPVAQLRLAQAVLRLLVPDRCTELLADGGHHGQQPLVRFPGAEELDDGHHFVAGEHGHGHGGVEPEWDGKVGSGEVVVSGDVADPRRSLGRPHPARQPHARCERRVQAKGDQRAGAGHGRVPGAAGLQPLAVGTRQPDLAQRPPRLLADLGQHSLEGAVEVGGAAHGPLDALGQTAPDLGVLAVSDVLDLRQEVEGLALGVVHQRHAQVHPDDPPLGVDVPLLRLVPTSCAGEHPGGGVDVVCDILGVGEVDDAGVQELLPGVPEDLAQRLVHPCPAQFESGDGHADGCVLEGRPEALGRLKGAETVLRRSLRSRHGPTTRRRPAPTGWRRRARRDQFSNSSQLRGRSPSCPALIAVGKAAVTASVRLAYRSCSAAPSTEVRGWSDTGPRLWVRYPPTPRGSSPCTGS